MEKTILEITTLSFSNSLLSKLPTFNEVPFKNNREMKSQLDKYDQHWTFYNFAQDNLIQPGYSWRENDVSLKMSHFLRRKTQLLCNGQVNTTLI